MATKRTNREEFELYGFQDNTGGGTVPAFLSKLWVLVEDPSNDDIICWDPAGSSFHIYDQSRFATEVLPYYFKHSNISSFIRQLNMYGFRKVPSMEQGALKTERGDLQFQHPYFVRGHEELLDKIKRKTGQPRSEQRTASVDPDSLSRVLNEVNQIKSKQEAFNNTMEDLKRENQILWREVIKISKKYQQQQQIINKLMHFLLSLVNQHGMAGISRKRPLMINAPEPPQSSPTKKANIVLNESGDHDYTVQSPSELEPAVSNTSGVVIQELLDNLESPLRSTPSPQYSAALGGGVRVQPASSGGVSFLNIASPATVASPGTETGTGKAPITTVAQLQAFPPLTSFFEPASVAALGLDPTSLSTTSVPSPTSIPTSTPTPSPTPNPTQSPTPNPTQSPTPNPTPVPVVNMQERPKTTPAQHAQKTLQQQQKRQQQQQQQRQQQQQSALSQAVSQELALRRVQDEPLSSSSSAAAPGGGGGPSLSPHDLSEQMNLLQCDLDNVREVLSSGQFNLDTNFILSLFDPETPLPLPVNIDPSLLDLVNTEEGSTDLGGASMSLPPQLPAASSDNGTTASQSGTEVLQYQPSDIVMPSLFEELPADGEDDLPCFFQTEDEDQGLHTPAVLDTKPNFNTPMPDLHDISGEDLD